MSAFVSIHAYRWLCGGALVAAAWMAQAQSVVATPVSFLDVPPMSLARAYTHALENDATLRAARAQTTGVIERQNQARAQLYPNLSFNASRFKNDLSRQQPNILGQTTKTEEQYFSYGQNLQLRQPLYRPQLGLGVDIARAQGSEAEAVLGRELQLLGVRVVEAYLQVLLAQESEALLSVQQQLALHQLDAAKKRFEGGQGIRTDIDEAQARIDMLTARQLEASQTRQTALLQLQQMTQQPAASVMGLLLPAVEATGFVPHTPDYWMERARNASPEMAAARSRLDAARLEVKRAEANHKPTLDAIIQIARSGSENVTATQSSYINRQVGLQLNLPLYAGGAVQSAVRQALAEQTRQEELLEASQRDLSLRVQREWRGLTEGALRIQAMERAVLSADKVVVSVRRSFEAGVRTVLDVLNAEQQAQQARRDLGEARLGYVAARVRLQALAGELTADQIQSVSSWFSDVAR